MVVVVVGEGKFDVKTGGGRETAMSKLAVSLPSTVLFDLVDK